MKCCLPALLLLASANLSLQAQQSYIVKPGEKITEALTFNQIYSYPKFADGTVVFTDGRTAAGKFNYNIVVAEIQFIDAKGDTLSLGNENTIRQILIAKDTFIYSNAYIKMISGNPLAKLGERTYFKDYIQKPGAYGVSSSASATNTVDLLVERRPLQIDHDHEINLVQHTDYVFSGTDNEFFVADKRTLPKAFPRFKKQLNTYLTSDPVDFRKREDLLRLCSFIGGLK